MRCSRGYYHDAFKLFRRALDEYDLVKPSKALANWKCLRLLTVLTKEEEHPLADEVLKHTEEASKTMELVQKLQEHGLGSISELSSTTECDAVWRGIDLFRRAFVAACRRRSM